MYSWGMPSPESRALSGGALYDHFASFTSAILLASLMSLAGGLLFLNEIRSVPHEHRA